MSGRVTRLGFAAALGADGTLLGREIGVWAGSGWIGSGERMGDE